MLVGGCGCCGGGGGVGVGVGARCFVSDDGVEFVVVATAVVAMWDVTFLFSSFPLFRPRILLLLSFHVSFAILTNLDQNNPLFLFSFSLSSSSEEGASR